MEKRKETRRRMLGIAGGVAGAAAVITGAVFGLNWLNEHGGLKGPDVRGAGYNEGLIEPSGPNAALAADEESAGTKDILLAAGDVLEFTDMTAEIKNVEYDGQFLVAAVSTEYYGGNYPSDTEYVSLGLLPVSKPGYVGAAVIDERDMLTDRALPDPDNENKRLHKVACYVKPEPGQSADFTVAYYPPDLDGKSEKLGNYTLTGRDMSGETFTAEDANAGISVTVSAFGAVIESPHDYSEDERFDLTLRFGDGSELVLADRDTTLGETLWSPDRLYDEYHEYFSGLGCGRTCVMSVKAEPIDVKNVAGVLINGEEIGASSDTSGSKDILQSVGDVLEFSDMTAKISKYDYDGQFLRVMVEATYQYPLSETEGFDRLDLNVKNIGNYDVGEFCLNDYQYVTAPYYHEIAEMIWNDPNADNWDEAADMDRFGRTVMYDMGIYIRLAPGQTAELQFGHLPAQGSVREYAGNYTLTGLTGIETAEAFYTVTDKETDTTVNVSRYGAFVEGANDFGKDDSFSLAVKYKDGTQKLLADRPVKKETYPTDDIPYYRFASYYTELGRGRAYMMSSVFMDGKIDVANISAVVINGREISDTDSEGDTTAEYYDPTAERNTYISIDYSHANVSGRYEFLYYIDGELQKDMTETRELSDTDKFRWDVAGSGVHRYKVLLRNPETRYYEILFDVSINFTKREPEKTFIGEFDPKIFKNVAEKEVGDLSLIAGIYAPGEEPYEVVESEKTSGNTSNVTPPEFPIAVSNGNGFYGEFLDPPITGDEAWELVKQRGGIDFDYNLPYDKSLFTFTGAAFVIDYADCDVKAIVGGTVEYAGWYPGWGQTVLLQDENGHYWLYGHLGEISAAEGDKVERGAKLGHTGTTGNTTNQLYALRVG